MKNFIKEFIVTVLLCIAIIAIMGVVLYSYIPASKDIPEAPKYETPAEIKEALNSNENLEDEKIVMTYDIDSTDLNNYKKTENYKPGRIDPFSDFSEETITSKPIEGGKPSSNNNKPNGGNKDKEDGYLHKDTGNLK